MLSLINIYSQCFWLCVQIILWPSNYAFASSTTSPYAPLCEANIYDLILQVFYHLWPCAWGQYITRFFILTNTIIPLWCTNKIWSQQLWYFKYLTNCISWGEINCKNFLTWRWHTRCPSGCREQKINMALTCCLTFDCQSIYWWWCPQHNMKW